MTERYLFNFAFVFFLNLFGDVKDRTGKINLIVSFVKEFLLPEPDLVNFLFKKALHDVIRKQTHQVLVAVPAP